MRGFGAEAETTGRFLVPQLLKRILVASASPPNSAIP